jgi:hypothetical protein
MRAASNMGRGYPAREFPRAAGYDVRAMTEELLEGLGAARHRDLAGRGADIWVRRAGLGLLAAFVVAALLNVFGQHPRTAVAQGAGTRLSVRAPAALRGGDLYQVHLVISTTTGIASPKVLLGQGFLDGFTINTVKPDASSEVSHNGPVALMYDRLGSGRRMEVFIEGQVNSNTVGRRHWDIDVYDGTRLITGVHRTITIFP